MAKLPPELLSGLKGAKGFDPEKFEAIHNTVPPTSVRIHPEKGGDYFSDKQVVPWCDTGRYLEERPVFTLDPAFHAGAYYVQEASSMFLHHAISSLTAERKGLRVLDLCAAPGGKSTLIASLLDKTSLLVSNEVIRSRASILEENMSKWGYMNTWVTCNAPKDLGKLKGYFDIIVVDAPCSGSGLFRKDEAAIDEWSTDNVALCSQRQQKILADVMPALKEGGTLIYSTCSYSTEEDEDILEWLAADFELATMKIPLEKEWGVVEVETEEKHMYGYRFYPYHLSGEGFFIAALQKQSEQKEMKEGKYKSAHDLAVYKQSSFLLESSNWLCLSHNDEYRAIYIEQEKDYHLLKGSVFFRKLGLGLGTPIKKQWLPSHDVALSIDKSKSLPAIELDRSQALKYLKKEEADLPDMEKGWYMVSYNGLGLGWLKNVGGRYNNYLPKHWRIRMDIDA